MINQKYFLFGFFFVVAILQNAVFAQNDLVKNINVNSYNIFGNDTIDDSYAFRNLMQTIDEPCVFYFPAGTYIFSNIGEDSSASSVKKTGIAPYLIIRIKSNTTLKGDGAGKSFLLIKGQHNTDKLQPTDFAEFSIYPGSNNIHFDNLTIKGDITKSEYKYNGRTQNSAIYFFYNGSHKVKTTNCSISNCTFENLAGFVANGECRNFSFTDNTVRFTGNGVNVQSLRDLNGYVTYTGNKFFHCEGIESASNNMIIANNNFTDTYGAISAGGMTSRSGFSKNITISDNTITGNKTYSAIIIQSGVSSCIVKNNLVKNSYIGAITLAPYYGKDKNGSYVVGVDSVTLINNTIINTTTVNHPSTYAIDVNSFCNKINIINNLITYDSENAGYRTGGIVINPNAETYVKNNRIKVNYYKAILESSVKGNFNYVIEGNNLSEKELLTPHAKTKQ